MTTCRSMYLASVQHTAEICDWIGLQQSVDAIVDNINFVDEKIEAQKVLNEGSGNYMLVCT